MYSAQIAPCLHRITRPAMAAVRALEQFLFPFGEDSDIDELDVIGASSSSTRSATVVGDATPPTSHKLKFDTLVIPASKGKRSRTLSEQDGPHAWIRKKQKMGDKKAVSLFLSNLRLYADD